MAAALRPISVMEAPPVSRAWRPDCVADRRRRSHQQIAQLFPSMVAIASASVIPQTAMASTVVLICRSCSDWASSTSNVVCPRNYTGGDFHHLTGLHAAQPFGTVGLEIPDRHLACNYICHGCLKAGFECSGFTPHHGGTAALVVDTAGASVGTTETAGMLCCIKVVWTINRA